MSRNIDTKQVYRQVPVATREGRVRPNCAAPSSSNFRWKHEFFRRLLHSPVNSASRAMKWEVRMASHIVSKVPSKFSLVMFMVQVVGEKTKCEGK